MAILKSNMVILKSPYCQAQFFKAKAECMINMDAPGATNANLRSLGHKHCPQPIYPLDADVEFTPSCELFPRGRAL